MLASAAHADPGDAGDKSPASSAPADLIAGLSGGGWSDLVPLELPPAPMGLVPGLAISIDFQQLDGPLGHSASLHGVSRVELRSMTGGVPWLDGTDDALVDGQRLYAQGTFGLSHRQEQDDRREFVFFPGTNTWEATRDGWTWTWGSVDTTDCAVERRDEDASWDCAADFGDDRLADAETTAWLLSRVEDPFGNSIAYRYTTGAGLAGVDTYFSGTGEYALEHVLASISYAAGYHRVDLSWEARPDVPSSARSGVMRASPLRLAGIAVTSNVGGMEGSRESDAAGPTYAMVYADEETVTCEGESAASLDVLASSGLSLLHRVVRVEDGATYAGANGRDLRCIERASDEASFELDAANPWTGSHLYAEAGFAVSTDPSAPPPTPSTTHLAASFDGDALPDLLHVSTQCQGGGAPFVREEVMDCTAEWQYFLNDGGHFTEATTDADTPGAVAWLAANLDGEFLDDGGAWAILDLDRDGVDDVIAATSLASTFDDGTILSADEYLVWTEDDDLDLDPDDEGIAAEILRHAQWADVDGDGFTDLLLPPQHAPRRHLVARRARRHGLGAQQRRGAVLRRFRLDTPGDADGKRGGRSPRRVGHHSRRLRGQRGDRPRAAAGARLHECLRQLG